jgi:integrase
MRGVVFVAKDKAEAQRKFRKLEAAAEEAVYANQVPRFLDELDRRYRPQHVDTGPGFRKFAEEWEQTCILNAGLRESTIESDCSILKNHLIPFFGKYGLKAIDARVVDRYKATKRREKHQYGDGYSAKTINNHLSVLHRIFEKAIEYEVIDKNPVTKRAWLKRETTPEDSENWWSPDEELAAITTLEKWKVTDPDKRLVLLTQIITGMRFGEIRALEKRDLDLGVPGLWVRRAMARKKLTTPKNKRARLQVIPRGLAQELREHMLKTEGQWLFPGIKNGPLANNSLNRWYRKLAAEAGVRPISSHGARHTSGSSYAVMGCGQKMIAQLLGHSDTGATERYTHIQVEATQPLVEARWARLVGDQGKQ